MLKSLVLNVILDLMVIYVYNALGLLDTCICMYSNLLVIALKTMMMFVKAVLLIEKHGIINMLHGQSNMFTISLLLLLSM